MAYPGRPFHLDHSFNHPLMNVIPLQVVVTRSVAIARWARGVSGREAGALVSCPP